MYQDLPLFRCIVKVGTALGFIRPPNYAKIFLLCFVPVITNICQYIHFYKVFGRLEDMVFVYFLMSSLTFAIVRLGIVVQKEATFIALLEQIDQVYEIVKRSRDSASYEILTKIGRRSYVLAKVHLSFIVIAAFILPSIPILSKGKQLSWEIYMPGIDLYSSPMYEIACIVQTLTLPTFFMITFTPYTSLFSAILMVITGCLQILRGKLERLQDASDMQLRSELRKCIELHLKIFKFRDMFEEIFSWLSLLELLVHSTMICMLFCYFVSANTLYSRSIAAFFIYYMTCSLFTRYMNANAVTDEGLNIPHAVYSVNWTIAQKEVRMYVLFMLIRSQKPIKITAGGIYPLTLNTFQRMMNLSYRYFTLLQGTN